MQFNVKHCIAIGLGFGVTVAYCFHKETYEQAKIPFQEPAYVLSDLSSFELPDPGIPKLDIVNPAEFSKLQQEPVLNPDGEKQRVDKVSATSEEAKPTSDAFELTTSLIDSEPLISDLTLPADYGQSNVDDEHLKTNQIELVSNQPGKTSLPVIKNDPKIRPRLSRSGWQKNPFAGKSHDVPAIQSSFQNTNPSLEDLSPVASFPQTQSEPQLDRVTPETVELTGPGPVVEQEASILENDGPETDWFADPADTSRDSLNQSGEDEADVTIHRSEEQQLQRLPMDQQPVAILPEAAESKANRLRTELSSVTAQQAAQHIEYGKSLSRRGAIFAARQEFFLALSVIAQSRDESKGGQEFSRALSRGFMALKETEGFVVDNLEAGSTLNVASVVETHRCDVLISEEAALLSPAQATQRYIEFAKQQLDQACGRNVVTAEALFCLGKLYTAVSKTRPVPSNLDSAKSIAFHQASLQSDERNYRSSNELGVLLAQSGRLEEAKQYLKKSLIVRRTPQAWKNLAVMHRQLGEIELAELAESEFVIASQAPVADSTSPIQWVPTESFSTSAPIEYQPRVASKTESLQPSSAGQSKFKAITKSFSERLKELF